MYKYISWEHVELRIFFYQHHFLQHVSYICRLTKVQVMLFLYKPCKHMAEWRPTVCYSFVLNLGTLDISSYDADGMSGLLGAVPRVEEWNTPVRRLREKVFTSVHWDSTLFLRSPAIFRILSACLAYRSVDNDSYNIIVT